MSVPNAEAVKSAEPVDQPRSRAQDIHRSEVIRWIYIPFGLGLLNIVLIVAIASLLSNSDARNQVAGISDFLVSIIILCPGVICLFPLVILVVVAVYGVNKLHDGTQKPLDRLENLSLKLSQRINHTTEIVNKRTVDISAKIAPVLKFFSIFDESSKKD